MDVLSVDLPGGPSRKRARVDSQEHYDPSVAGDFLRVDLGTFL